MAKREGGKVGRTFRASLLLCSGLLFMAFGAGLQFPKGVYASFNAIVKNAGNTFATAALEAGNTPTADNSTLQTTVNLSWTATSGGSLVEGYQIRSYNASTSVERTVGASCSGIITSTSCAETSVPDGSWKYTVTARQQLWSGPESGLSNAIFIDTTAPAAPSTPDLTSATDSGSSNSDNITNDATPTFSGTAEAGSTVTIFDGVTSVGTGTATGGNYSITTSALGTGGRTITAKATDATGNVSASSSGLGVSIDTTAPSAPSTPDLTTDSGSSSTDDITNDPTSTFGGTAETDSTVAILSAGSLVGTGAATGGSYSVTTSTLSDGSHTITATATDTAGNVSAASSSLVITVDASTPTAPLLPDLDATSDSGTSSADNITNSVTPTFSGSGAETSSTVTIYDGGSQIGSAASSGSTYTGLTTSGIGTGTRTITAKVTDVAGNTSAASLGLTVIVDTTTPSSVNTVPAASSFYNNTTWTAACTSTVCGTATDNNAVASVAVSVRQGTGNYWNGTSFGSASEVLTTAAGTASWTRAFLATSFPAEGAYTARSVATDVAGNSSSGSSTTFTIDRTAPSSSDIQTTNAGTQGLAETSDTIIYTYSEQVGPGTILTGWSGASQNVVVRIIDGGCLLPLITLICADDSFTVETTGGVLLPFSPVDLKRGDYNGVLLGTATPLTFNSTMVQSGSTITVTLGTKTNGNASTAASNGNMVWTPSITVNDLAGNAATATARTETGTADKDF